MRRFSYVLIVCSCLFTFDCRILFQLPAWKLRHLRDTAISAAGNQNRSCSPLIWFVSWTERFVIQHPDGSVYEATEISEGESSDVCP